METGQMFMTQMPTMATVAMAATTSALPITAEDGSGSNFAAVLQSVAPIVAGDNQIATIAEGNQMQQMPENAVNPALLQAIAIAVQPEITLETAAPFSGLPVGQTKKSDDLIEKEVTVEPAAGLPQEVALDAAGAQLAQALQLPGRMPEPELSDESGSKSQSAVTSSKETTQPAQMQQAREAYSQPVVNRPVSALTAPEAAPAVLKIEQLNTFEPSGLSEKSAGAEQTVVHVANAVQQAPVHEIMGAYSQPVATKSVPEILAATAAPVVETPKLQAAASTVVAETPVKPVVVAEQPKVEVAAAPAPAVEAPKPQAAVATAAPVVEAPKLQAAASTVVAETPVKPVVVAEQPKVEVQATAPAPAVEAPKAQAAATAPVVEAAPKLQTASATVVAETTAKPVVAAEQPKAELAAVPAPAVEAPKVQVVTATAPVVEAAPKLQTASATVVAETTAKPVVAAEQPKAELAAVPAPAVEAPKVQVVTATAAPVVEAAPKLQAAPAPVVAEITAKPVVAAEQPKAEAAAVPAPAVEAPKAQAVTATAAPVVEAPKLQAAASTVVAETPVTPVVVAEQPKVEVQAAAPAPAVEAPKAQAVTATAAPVVEAASKLQTASATVVAEATAKPVVVAEQPKVEVQAAAPAPVVEASKPQVVVATAAPVVEAPKLQAAASTVVAETPVTPVVAVEQPKVEVQAAAPAPVVEASKPQVVATAAPVVETPKLQAAASTVVAETPVKPVVAVEQAKVEVAAAPAPAVEATKPQAAVATAAPVIETPKLQAAASTVVAETQAKPVVAKTETKTTQETQKTPVTLQTSVTQQQFMEAYSKPVAAKPVVIARAEAQAVAPQTGSVMEATETIAPEQTASITKASAASTETAAPRSETPSTVRKDIAAVVVSEAKTTTSQLSRPTQETMPVMAETPSEPVQAAELTTGAKRVAESGAVPVRTTVKGNEAQIRDERSSQQTTSAASGKPATGGENLLSAALKEPSSATGEDASAEKNPEFDQKMAGNLQNASIRQNSTIAAPVTVSALPEQPQPAALSEHVAKQVNERIAAHEIKSGTDQIVLRLTPENMGEVKVNLRMENQKLTVEIVTDNKTVTDALRQNSDSLKETLAKQNIKMESFDVSTGGGSDNLAGKNSRNMGEWQEMARNKQANQWKQGGYNIPAAAVADSPTILAANSRQGLVDVHY